MVLCLSFYQKKAASYAKNSGFLSSKFRFLAEPQNSSSGVKMLGQLQSLGLIV
jgi:hypothetical protein